MSTRIRKLSPLPLVSSKDTTTAIDGWSIPTNSFCKKRISSDPKCINHYKRLFSCEHEVLIECPHGFSSIAFSILNDHIAFTSFIPFPRHQTKQERDKAKKYKNTKISFKAIQNFIEIFKAIARDLLQIEKDKIASLPSALHEIRKYNRTVKQEAERYCRENSPANPENADKRIVNIWKASDMMSQQFDIVEILANEELPKLPLKTESDVFRIIDKTKRLYSEFARGEGKTFRINGPSPIVLACDKTFPILITTLLENAAKHSLPNSEIRIKIEKTPQNQCLIQVSNLSKTFIGSSEKVFEKGERGGSDSEGTGLGLYLARLVAEQHNGVVELKKIHHNLNVDIIYLNLTLPVIRFSEPPEGA